MNINAIAAQIRSLSTVFSGNVAGAAGYYNGVSDQAWLPLPAAYVLPDDEDAENNISAAGLDQIIHERVAVIVVISTLNAGGEPDTADRRGQAAAAQFDIIRKSIWRAILNWRPREDGGDTITQQSSKGIYYIAAGYPAEGAFDRARAFRRFTFGLDTFITDEDGWQQPFDPLVAVDGTITQPQSPMVGIITVNVPLPPANQQP